MSRIPVTSLLLLVSVQAKGFKRGIGGPVWRPLCLEAANGARLMRSADGKRWAMMEFRPFFFFWLRVALLIAFACGWFP
jgi:hypothetical protein